MPLSDHLKRAPVEPEANLELRPIRGQLRPAQQLHEAAYTAVGTAVATCEVFGVGLKVPGWVSGQLERYRDNPSPPPL
jgi:hypothetical protein